MPIPNPVAADESDTSAHRLGAVLSTAMRFPRKLLTRDVWARAVSGVAPEAEAPPADDLAAAMAVTQVLRLLCEFDKELDLLAPVVRKPYKQVVHDLTQCIRLELTQHQWHETASRIEQSHVLHKLELAAAHLSTVVQNRLIATDQLTAWARELDDLREQVLRDSSLPDDLRRMVVESLSFLSDSVAEYRLRGQAGLEAALDRCLGRLLRLREELRDVRGHEHSRGWISKLSTVLADIEEVTTQARNVVDNVKFLAATAAVCALPFLPGANQPPQ